MTETAPNSVMGHWGLARAYLDANRLDAAKHEAEIAYSIDKNYPPLLNTLGDIAYREKNYTLAKEIFLRAIDVAPHVFNGYQNAAMVYMKTGEYEKAKKMLEYMVFKSRVPRMEDVIDLSLVLTILGSYEESLNVINTYYKGDFKDPKLRMVMAIDLYQVGRVDEAKKYFDFNPTLSEEEKIRLLEKLKEKK